LQGIFDSLTWGVIPAQRPTAEEKMEVPVEILSRYMERRKKDLESCLFNFESENFQELEKVGHQLKGNGLTFGHPDLSSIGSHLEVAAAAQDQKEIELALKDFSLWVNTNIN
jgi:HPt (histidine-containing phosphotransfer) domain-containing protein